MKSQWDFGTVIGLIAGIICIYVTMIWPEKEASEIILTKGGGWRFEELHLSLPQMLSARSWRVHIYKH